MTSLIQSFVIAANAGLNLPLWKFLRLSASVAKSWNRWSESGSRSALAPAGMDPVDDVRDQLVVHVVGDEIAGPPHGEHVGVALRPVGREVRLPELPPEVERLCR